MKVLRIRPEIIFIEIRPPGMSGIECMCRLKVILPGDDRRTGWSANFRFGKSWQKQRRAPVGLRLTAKSGVHPIVRLGKIIG